MDDKREISSWLVACLCAQWCGTCREYRATFERQAAAFAGTARFAWVDVEDHPGVLDPDEVEGFPTLVIASGEDVVFFGPVTPHEATLARLLRTALAGGLAPLRDPAAAPLPARIRALP